jgi:hypothetical protein
MEGKGKGKGKGVQNAPTRTIHTPRSALFLLLFLTSGTLGTFIYAPPLKTINTP